jgi:hypothetical protein
MKLTQILREFRLRSSPAPREAVRMQAVNRSRGVPLALCLEVADNAKTRGKGLLGRSELPAGAGLWIVPCESVHTFFMRFPIDLVYLDRSRKVRKVREAVPAWRVSACLTAHSVLELPAGTIRRTGTRAGDMLEILPS